MSTEAEIEAAAKAMRPIIFRSAAPSMLVESERNQTRADARAALAAVEPLLRERLAQDLEASRHDPPVDVTVAISGYPSEAQTVLSAMWHLGIDGSVRIVRGDAS